jgi:hypothetical protein
LKIRNCAYALNADNIEKYKREIEKLKQEVHLWPPQDQVLNKYQLIKQLDLIAARRTISARPVTHRLEDIDNIDPTKVVLKRTHSDMCQHVILPGDETKYTKEYLECCLEVPGSFWFAQTFVPMLRELGEWRVFIIGGRIVYVVHTHHNWAKGIWMSETPTTYYSLHGLRCVLVPAIHVEISNIPSSLLHASGELLETNICNPDQGDRTTCDEAEIEFRTFVLQRYEELYAMESRRTYAKPSISLFCQLDIGILIDGEGQAHYFVNEVEKTQTTSLWSNRQHAQALRIPAQMLGHTFAKVFYDWLLSLHNPYAAG